MKKLLLVVDMIKGFITEGNLHDKAIGKIIPACENYIKEYLSEGWEVIAFCDTHKEDSREFAVYPLHCLAGTTESELVDELVVYSEQLKIIPKNSTDGFFAPGFAETVDKLNEYEEILIVGCCSDICVLQLALSLKAYCNQHDYDIKIIVDEAACATFDIPGHDKEEYNAKAFQLMRNAGITVVEGREDE